MFGSGDRTLALWHWLSGVRAAPVLRKATGAAKTMRAEEWLELRARELRTLGGIIPGGFNVAGLADPAKCNWYPVATGDLFAAATKLGASTDRIREMLLREQLL